MLRSDRTKVRITEITYRTDPETMFSRGAVHLVAEALDVVEGVDDCKRVPREAALDGGEEGGAGGFFGFRVCMSITECILECERRTSRREEEEALGALASSSSRSRSSSAVVGFERGSSFSSSDETSDSEEVSEEVSESGDA